MQIPTNKELIISKEELISLFLDGTIKETNYGWIFNTIRIDIVALHDKDVKYILNVTDTQEYKIVFKI